MKVDLYPINHIGIITTLPDGREKIAGLPFATEDQCSGLHYDKGKGQFYKKEATGNESTHQIQAF